MTLARGRRSSISSAWSIGWGREVTKHRVQGLPSGPRECARACAGAGTRLTRAVYKQVRSAQPASVRAGERQEGDWRRKSDARTNGATGKGARQKSPKYRSTARGEVSTFAPRRASDTRRDCIQPHKAAQAHCQVNCLRKKAPRTRHSHLCPPLSYGAFAPAFIPPPPS